MELDMTSGKPLNTLLKFSLPLLAGSVIQNLYNIFDTAIVGHVLGKYALAAVGNSYVPTLIINSIVLGIASGISILVAQLYGSKDKGQICKCYGSVQTLIVAVGFGLAVLFFALAGWIFKAMQIPEEITSPAALYLRIVAAGIPFLAIYNFYSALIKAKGDSRTPIRCICLSCVLNILLDYLFVACFGWGIVGAASATVLSQALAAVLVGLHLYRQEHPVIRTAPSAGLIVPILQLSITGIVQNGASAISMFFIQGIINTS